MMTYRKTAKPLLASVRTFRSVPLILTVIALAAVLCLLGLSGVFSNNIMRYLFRIFLYISMGEMWNLMSGFAGMTSLGQQAYIGLAGYAVAAAVSIYKLPFPVGLLAGMAVALIFSVVLAPLLFRMSGMYFSISTWVVSEALTTLFLSWKFVNQGGGMAIMISPYPKTRELYFMSLSLCVCSILLVYGILRSRIGLGLVAMRDDATAAYVLGVNVFRCKMIVYVTASVLIALAGGIFFISKGTIYPESAFSISWTISMVFIVIIGGAGTVIGPVIGAAAYVILEELLAHYPGWSDMILGIVSIFTILFFPGGLWGFVRRKWNLEIFSPRRFSE